MMKEVSISKIVQSLRVLKAVAKKDKKKEEWSEIKKNHGLLAYEDFMSDESESTNPNRASKATQSQR